LRSAGFSLVGLTPAGEPIEHLTTGPDDRLALLVGAEGPGLSADALAAVDRRAAIPMSHDVDSLNVASATAVALWALRAPTGEH
jgi:tRNA G18 (ribose-2'-O)-methylase SpoU